MKFWEAMKAMQEGKSVKVQAFNNTYIARLEKSLDRHKIVFRGEYETTNHERKWAGLCDWVDFEFEIYEPTISFIEAWQALLDGKKVRNKAMVLDTYYYRSGPHIMLSVPNVHDSIVKVLSVSWMLSNDWIILD